MKKIFIFSFLFCLFINNCYASTSTASSYVLMDETTGEVLLSKNMDSKKLIASITKIMTCVIAIESGKVDDIVVVDDTIKKAYGSSIYIEVGEEISLKDLLYGLMLRSGNDASLMISSYVSGNVSDFVNVMNNKAMEIGMKNTYFVNPSGLDNDDGGNYSTSYDMALLTRYAMKYPLYREIVSTKNYVVKTNKKTYSWTNKNKLLYKYEYTTGGKTGYTEKAHRTLVSTASINNMNLIVVTLNDGDDWNTHIDLYEYVRNNYVGYKVLDKSNFDVIDDYYKGNFYIDHDVYIPLLRNKKYDMVNHIVLYKLKEYKNRDVVGINNIYINNRLVYSDNIYIDNIHKDKKYGFWDRVRDIF